MSSCRDVEVSKSHRCYRFEFAGISYTPGRSVSPHQKITMSYQCSISRCLSLKTRGSLSRVAPRINRSSNVSKDYRYISPQNVQWLCLRAVRTTLIGSVEGLAFGGLRKAGPRSCTSDLVDTTLSKAWVWEVFCQSFTAALKSSEFSSSRQICHRRLGLHPVRGRFDSTARMLQRRLAKTLQTH